MVHIIGKLVDFILPPADAVKIVRTETPETFARFYAPQMVGSSTALASYGAPEVRATIRACKFYHDSNAAALLASLLDHWLERTEQCFLIIPVPLSAERERERGHNQVLTVLNKSSLLTRHSLAPHALRRVRNTQPQTELERNARLSNVVDAFTINDSKDLSGAHILLIDDVVTTGATLGAAKAALSPHQPASITCLAFAH